MCVSRKGKITKHKESSQKKPHSPFEFGGRQKVRFELRVTPFFAFVFKVLLLQTATIRLVLESILKIVLL